MIPQSALAVAVAVLASMSPLLFAQGASPRVPDGVTAHRDIAYVPDGHPQQKLDLFVPDNAKSPLPLIVWVHGGGWQSGSKNGCPPLRDGYTERGYAVASIDYRLSGVAPFPAQIEDCKAAIRWLRAHAAKYNLDPQRIGIWGSSAGGHLVALMGTTGDTDEFKSGPHPEVSSSVQAVCDYFGPTDLVEFVKTPGYDRDPAPSRFLGGPVLSLADKARQANPINYISRSSPPFLIAHGDQDRTVPHGQSVLLYSALVKAGVPVRFITVKGGGHGLGFPEPVLRPIVAEFFDRHLQAKADAANWPADMASEINATPNAPAAGGAGDGQRRVNWARVVADDRDRDGQVTREEFKGPPALFNRLDRNGDAALTKEDFNE